MRRLGRRVAAVGRVVPARRPTPLPVPGRRMSPHEMEAVRRMRERVLADGPGVLTPAERVELTRLGTAMLGMGK